MSCAPDDDCTDNTFALTDSRPEEDGPRTMTICPAFWDAEWAEISRLLPGLPSEGEYPDPDLFAQWGAVEDDEWEAITPNYRTFVTPEHVLHEITHLDIVGQSLAWPADSLGSSGTFDYNTFQGSEDLPNDAFWQARQLQVLFNQAPDRTDTGDPVVVPGRNAESLAGTGTENYFVRFCNVPHIAPENGVGPGDVNDHPEADPEWEIPDPPEAKR